MSDDALIQEVTVISHKLDAIQVSLEDIGKDISNQLLRIANSLEKKSRDTMLLVDEERDVGKT